MVLTLSDLSEKLAKKHELPASEAKSLIQSLFTILTDELVAGNEISVRQHFGLKTKVRKEKLGNIIRRGAGNSTPVVVPAHRVVVFQPSLLLAEKLKKI